jgi:ribosomal-protein-alanine N-acetyltransferase
MQEPWPYSIRPMEPGDIPSVVAIDRLSFPTPWSASSYAYELKHRNSSFFYVLLNPDSNDGSPPERGWWRWLHSATGLRPQRSHVIGYVGIRLRDAGTHISTIAVHPDWRGNGLGELLLLTVIEQSAKMESSLVTLEVRPSNKIAQSLYQKYGFRFTGVHEGYYRDGENAWLMAVEIDRNIYRKRLAELHQALEQRLCNPAQRQHAIVLDVGQKDADTL